MKNKRLIDFFLIFFVILSLFNLLLLIFKGLNVLINLKFNTHVLTISLLCFCFLSLFFYLKKNEENYIEKIKNLFCYIFYISLFLIILSLFPLEFINHFSSIKKIILFLNNNQIFLIILTIISRVIYHYPRKKILKDVENENNKEKKEELKRLKKYENKFNVLKIKKIIPNKYVSSPFYFLIKFFDNIFKWVYKEGWIYILCLFLIMFIFTAIKLPYFETPFIGEHSMKYNSHVEPAKYMYELNNPFHFQKKYFSDPINNPQGIFDEFHFLPVHEWGILSLMYLFPNQSLEFNTRLWTHFLGLLIILFSYLFFSRLFNKKLSLIITFLISINPIFYLLSFVTVQDSLILIFTLIALIYLIKYTKSKNIFDLYLVGLFFGIGNTIKYSIFLWLAPIIFFILVFNSKKLNIFLRDFCIIIFISILSIVSFKTSLINLPSSILIPFLLFIIWILIFYFLFYFINKYEKRISLIFSKIIFNKLLFFGLIFLFLFFSIFVLYFTQIISFFDHFLTDLSLIFHWGMYNHLFTRFFKSQMNHNIFYLGLIGFVFNFILGSIKHKKILISFIVGSLIFCILASKSIFFHNYYLGIIIITFSLSIGLMFYLLSKSIKSKTLLVFLILLILAIIFPTIYEATIDRLERNLDLLDDLKEVTEYLIENSEENEIFLDINYNSILIFYTNRAQTNRQILDNEEIRDSVMDIGFKETMDKYNISYMIHNHANLYYDGFANLFSEGLEPVEISRSDAIKSMFDSKYAEFKDSELRKEIVESENIRRKIYLKEDFGHFKIFAFRN